MSKDKLTTILGVLVAALIGAGVLTQEQATIVQQAGGIIAALLIAAWGWATNKG